MGTRLEPYDDTQKLNWLSAGGGGQNDLCPLNIFERPP